MNENAKNDLKEGLLLYNTENNVGLKNAWNIIQAEVRAGPQATCLGGRGRGWAMATCLGGCGRGRAMGHLSKWPQEGPGSGHQPGGAIGGAEWV